MRHTNTSGRAARAIVTGVLAMIGIVAGVASGPTLAAVTGEGWYVVVDDHGNVVVPEWNDTVPASVTAERGGYAIVGEGGETYIPEHAGNEVATGPRSGAYAVVIEGGAVISPEEGIGVATEVASAPSSEIGGYVIVDENGVTYVPESVGVLA